MDTHAELSPKDLEFLATLDNKLHFVEKGDNGYRQTSWDSYTDERMATEEAKRLLDLVVSSTELVLHPINTNMGFSVGFRVLRVNAPYPGIADYASAVQFTEKQLPKGYAWQTLADVFNSPSHVGKVKTLGLPESAVPGFNGERFRGRSSYDY